MGFFSSDPKWMATPGSGALAQQYKDYGNSVGLGMAGNIAKHGLKQFANGGGEKGYDTGIVGNLLAPLRDQYGTMQRESNRGYGMGALGMTGASNPAQMARLKQLGEDRIGESMGHAYAQALPGIFNSLSSTYGDARSTRIGAEMGALQGQGQALGMGQWVSKPSIFDNIMKVGQLGSSIAGMVMGMPGGGGLPQTASRVNSPGFFNVANSVPSFRP